MPVKQYNLTLNEKGCHESTQRRSRHRHGQGKGSKGRNGCSILMTMWEVKTHKPQESDKEDVPQGHTKEGLTKQMINVITTKDSNIIVLNVETLLKILRRKPTMLKIKTKAQLNLLLVYKRE